MSRVLIVDDVKLFRHLESSVLGGRGYTIEEACSGEEALEKIKQNPPDVVLVDLAMPGMSGQELCRTLKTHPDTYTIPVIVVTSSSAESDIRSAVQAGCDDVITKPLDDESLVRKIEDALGDVDKRRFPRVPTSLSISFEDFKGIFFEFIRDLSRTGVFIEMDEPLPVDTCLRLSFSLPEPFRQAVFAYGRVVRQVPRSEEGPGGVGVRFIHIDEHSRRMIDALVAAKPQLETTHQTGVFSRVSLQREDRFEGSSAFDALLKEREGLKSALEQLQLDHLRLSTLLVLAQNLYAEESPRRVLEVAGDILRDVVGIGAFGIYLHDPSPGALVPVLTHRLAGAVAQRLPLDGPVQAALQTRAVQLPVPPWSVPGTASKVLVVVPMLSGDRVLGVITAHELFPQKSSLTVNDHQLLQTLGHHLGLALANAAARSLLPGPLDTNTLLKTLNG